jgi:hypothetical protein
MVPPLNGVCVRDTANPQTLTGMDRAAHCPSVAQGSIIQSSCPAVRDDPGLHLLSPGMPRIIRAAHAVHRLTVRLSHTRRQEG